MQESSLDPLTIGIDARFGSKHVGLGRYTREVVSRLPACMPNVQFALFVRNVHEAWCAELQSSQVRLVAAPFVPYSLSEQLHFPKLIHRSHIHLLFSPHFNAPFLCPVPLVVTIHDLILHRFPNQTSRVKQFFYRSIFSRAVRHARSIICVSNFTQRELLECEGSDLEKKCSVIFEAASPHFFPREKLESDAVLQSFAITSPFFLYVGNAKEHKNLNLLFNAFRALPQHSPSLVLVTGGKEAEALSLPPGVLRIPSVSDDELACLYSRATAFVSPSLSEGFGLPIVEAQACGCPVIAVNAGSIPEVASAQAMLIEPIVSAMTTALQQIQSRPRPHPLPSRSWENVAAEVSRVLYASLLPRHHG